MKERSKYILILGILSLALGLSISVQIKQNPERYNFVSLTSIQTMKNDIKNYNNEIENLNKIIDEKSRKLEEFKIAREENDLSLEKYIQEEIESLKIMSGLKDIKGPGIVIVIGDNEERELVGENIQDDIIHDSEIQIILNDLKNAGAEAISINDERVIYRSEVKCGGPIIRINGKSSANPFVIKVIGNPKQLYSSMTAKESFGWTLKEIYNKKVEVEVKDDIHISKYNWLNDDFKHVKPIKEGELR